jgi:WD40 repeat protein
MDSSDSLKIDENLARFLAAYDQSIEGGDAGAATVHVPMPGSGPLPANERPITPLHPGAENEGSRGEVLPDAQRSGRMRSPFVGFVPGPTGGVPYIGRFELRRQLGKGGCGIVFLAYDPKLQREVALKIPRPEMLLNEDAKRRLIREALAAAEFDHPNLVPVFETGELGPVCYIATAFCPGQTLAEWLDRQAFPVPVRQAARLVATVAEAVQHAHDRGVLHRDLKPNNVILQELKLEENDEPPPGSVQLRGEHVLPRLVDFGLAKLAERGGPSETGTRQILGTPKYMAPEQAQARREDIGPPADVYGLGVILYEMLAGRAPYEGASDVEVLRQSVEGRPVPPRELRPDLPRDLEAICLKAMARTTTERYRTAIDLADDLRRFLDGRPTVARPLRWAGRAARWFRRNDQLVAIIVLATIVLFVTALGTWTSYQSRQFRRDRDTALSAQADRNRSEQEREYARQMRDAFFAWRSGNQKAATESLDRARRAANTLMEQTDFAYDYLARIVKADQLMVVCPGGPVTALAVAPDGARLASGHADGTVAVWDRATGKQLGAVRAHDSDVAHIAFALNGTFLISCGRDLNSGTHLSGWSVTRDGALTRAADGRHALGTGVNCFAVSPDGQTVYAGGDNGRVLKLSLTGAPPAEKRTGAPGHGAVVALVVARDGKRIVTADARGTVLSWTAELEPAPEGAYEFRAEVSALAATADGLPLIGFAGGGVWAVAPICHPLPLRSVGRVQWIATAPDGTFALSDAPGRVDIAGRYDLATGDTGDVRTGVFAPDGKVLFTGSRDGVIRSWDLTRDTPLRAARYTARISSASASFDGTVFAYSTPHHVVRSDNTFAEPTRRAQVAVRLLDDGSMRGVALAGREVVVTDFIGNTSSELMRIAVPDQCTATAAALTADGRTLAIGDNAGRLIVWSIGEKARLATFDTGVRPVRRVGLSEDGRYVAAPTATGIGVWSVGTSERVTNIETDESAAFCFFVPTNERIATAGRDGAVRVWSLAGKEELTLFGHVGRVTGLGCTPDGRTLVSGGATGEVKLWDLRTGQELFGLRRHSAPVTLITFSGNGKVLLTAGADQYSVWDSRE